MYFSPKENTCFACWDLSASFNILTMQHDQQKKPSVTFLESFDTSEVLNGFNSFLFCKHLICIPVECGDKSEHPLAFYLIREVCCRGFWKMSNEHKKVGANVIKLKIWWGKDEKMVYHPYLHLLNIHVMLATKQNRNERGKITKVWQTSLLKNCVSILFLYFYLGIFQFKCIKEKLFLPLNFILMTHQTTTVD